MRSGTMGRPTTEWTFNYHDLSRITGKEVNTIQVSRRRPGGFDPDNLESVLLWCARNARPGLKEEILRHAASISLVVDAKKRGKPTR